MVGGHPPSQVGNVLNSDPVHILGKVSQKQILLYENVT